MKLIKIASILFILFQFSFTSILKLKPKENMSIYNIKINAIDGSPIDLNDYKGKYILFVNVASECGFTGQYEDLQKLYDTYQDKLMVIGVPCNQFGGQEPGTSEVIYRPFVRKIMALPF